MPHSKTQIERTKVDCARLGNEATLVLEYEHIPDNSDSLLGKVFSGFDCEQKHECGVGQTCGTVTDYDWESCPFHKAFTK